MAIDKLNLNGTSGISDLIKEINLDKSDSSDNINFSEILNKAIGDVNDAQVENNEVNNLLAIGEIDNLHDASISAQKAELTLNLAIEVRNKIVDAYKEIMRLQF
jgi:flagellar hook-basal body complex protein FliE